MLGLFAVASVTLGYFDNVKQAILSANPKRKIFLPDKLKLSYYQEKFIVYKKIREFLPNCNATTMEEYI